MPCLVNTDRKVKHSLVRFFYLNNINIDTPFYNNKVQNNFIAFSIADNKLVLVYISKITSSVLNNMNCN